MDWSTYLSLKISHTYLRAKWRLTRFPIRLYRQVVLFEVQASGSRRLEVAGCGWSSSWPMNLSIRSFNLATSLYLSFYFLLFYTLITRSFCTLMLSLLLSLSHITFQQFSTPGQLKCNVFFFFLEKNSWVTGAVVESSFRCSLTIERYVQTCKMALLSSSMNLVVSHCLNSIHLIYSQTIHTVWKKKRGNATRIGRS